MSYKSVVKYVSCFTQLNIWRRIEEAVTRLTRNQFVRKGTRVRIPPSPFFRGRTYQKVGPFVLPRIDWAKGIGQVLASVVGYGQVGIRRTVNFVERGKRGHF